MFIHAAGLKLNTRTKKGSALLLTSFISVIGLMLMLSMSTLSQSNTKQISYQQDGKTAYYAAEAGIANSMDFFNSNFTNWGIDLNNTDLPTTNNPETLTNGSTYWINNLTYANNNRIAIIDVIGKYNGAFRKMRARIASSIPKYFNDYGLLTDGVLTIHGNKTLKMSIHANDGLSLTGPTTMQNGAEATQSVNSGAGAPSSTNPVGGYVDSVEVPLVPIDDLRDMAKTGLNIDISAADRNTQIQNAPAGSFIYVSNLHSSSNTLTLTGNMQGKIIFVDAGVTVGTSGSAALSNVMIISAGALTVNGSVDFSTAHAGLIDTVFACNGDITLNGSRQFQTLFWTNGSFRQNGSSVAGRVIAQQGITFNGSFTLSASNKLFDYGTFDNIATLSSWQEVSMDN